MRRCRLAQDWKVIDNPFAEQDRIVALPGIRPDIALFHAPLADCHGNVFVGAKRELMLMAHAARHTLVTVEEVTDDDLMNDSQRAAGVLPGIYVTQVAAAKRGAWPLAFWDLYPDDEAALAKYTRRGHVRRVHAVSRFLVSTPAARLHERIQPN
jgi:glutaconate CoA-transferase subunit A